MRFSAGGQPLKGVWWQVDGGGAVAFRSKPDSNARTKVVAEENTLVFAVNDPDSGDPDSGIPGWISTNTGLWLPTTYLIGPLTGRDGPSISEAAEAHAVHAASAAAAGYVRAPEGPPPEPAPPPVQQVRAVPEQPEVLGCVDSDWKCSLWAASGECEADAAFMAKACKLSCKLCTPGPEDEAAAAAAAAAGGGAGSAAALEAEALDAEMELLYAKAKAELPAKPQEQVPREQEIAYEVADAAVGNAGGDERQGPSTLPSAEVAAPASAAAETPPPPPPAVPERKILRTISSSGAGGGSGARRSLSSLPTKLITKSPSMKQEMDGTREAAKKVITMERPELLGDTAAVATPPPDESDLPSTLESERAWLKAERARMKAEGTLPDEGEFDDQRLADERAWLAQEKYKVQNEQDEIARALAEATAPMSGGGATGMGAAAAAGLMGGGLSGGVQ